MGASSASCPDQVTPLSTKLHSTPLQSNRIQSKPRSPLLGGTHTPLPAFCWRKLIIKSIRLVSFRQSPAVARLHSQLSGFCECIYYVICLLHVCFIALFTTHTQFGVGSRSTPHIATNPSLSPNPNRSSEFPAPKSSQLLDANVGGA